MIDNQIARQIMQFGQGDRVLTRAEKRLIVTLVETLAAEAGLGEALTVLWEQQKTIGYVLGVPCAGENLSDESRFLCKRIGRYWLVHSPARKDRGNVPVLKQRRIIAEQPRFVYEGIEGDDYLHHPVKRPGFEQVCFLCSAAGANPNEVLVPVELGTAGFLYGANFATLGHSHFTFWTEVPILQKYWPTSSLAWLCEHGDKLRCPAFSTFFNGLGAGNSLRHFHFQTLRESLPIFDAITMRELGRSGVQRLDWPMPAYRAIVPEGEDRSATISHLDALIAAWLDMAPQNTLNLAHRKDDQGLTHLIFVPRVDAAGKQRPPGVSNGFAGCEVCGRINVESREEFSRAIAGTPDDIEAMLKAVSPEPEHIEQLEAHFVARSR
ncbi:MAG: hypothetical protein ABFE01_28315 [Phycisphaerales bacterium]